VVTSTDVDGLLNRARRMLDRLSPAAAYVAWLGGAELVDIRPAAQRAYEGEVPGALLVERNVLEWRFDPASPARLPEATGHDLQVIVLCSEGYTSSLAAAALQQLGLFRATDVVGGFLGWRAAGLPTSDGDGYTRYAPTGRAAGARPR
jgi:rhodanese-related sulfurtransferase